MRITINQRVPNYLESELAIIRQKRQSRLPSPVEVQREIVAEIEGYQRVIDGARAVVENYRAAYCS